MHAFSKVDRLRRNEHTDVAAERNQRRDLNAARTLLSYDPWRVSAENGVAAGESPSPAAGGDGSKGRRPLRADLNTPLFFPVAWDGYPRFGLGRQAEEREKMTASMPQTLGVDISKEKLDVHLHPEGSGAELHNDRKGFSMLIKWLAGRVIARIVYEPTKASIIAASNAASSKRAFLSPGQSPSGRRFAEAIGTGEDGPHVDAELLARFGAMFELRLLTDSGAILLTMKDLLVAQGVGQGSHRRPQPRPSTQPPVA